MQKSVKERRSNMSLKKIAELTGTSVSTVSRVLNDSGHRCHTDGLAEKIWETAAKLKYVPNTAAANLRSGKKDTQEAFVVDIFLTRFDSMEEDIFFKELFQYLKEDLLKNGCVRGEILHAVDVLALDTKVDTGMSVPFKANVRTSQNAGIKENTGLIILGKCPENLISILRKRYAYIAGIDRNPTDYAYDEVICSGVTAAEKAVNYLINLGHKNIAYIGDCTYEARYIGYYQTLLQNKLPLSHSNVYPTKQTMSEGYESMQNILKSVNPPSAIFCANDSTALGVLKALKKHKKRGYLPSVISIDNIEDSQKTSPMLTTIDIPKKEMSHLAIMLLLDRKKNRHKENVRLELPCRLIERESCNYY